MLQIRPKNKIDKRFKYFIGTSFLFHAIILFWIFFYQVFIPHIEVSTITINLNAGGGNNMPANKPAGIKKQPVIYSHKNMVIPEKQPTFKNELKAATTQTTSTMITSSTSTASSGEGVSGATGSGTGSGTGTGTGFGSGEGIVSSNQLDSPPTIVKFENPVYPLEARKEGIEGVVILKVLIAPNGTIKDIKVLKSIPLLNRAAIDAVAKWRFSSITAHGNPVYVWMIIPIRFQLR